MKKLFLLALAVVASLALTACAGAPAKKDTMTGGSSMTSVSPLYCEMYGYPTSGSFTKDDVRVDFKNPKPL